MITFLYLLKTILVSGVLYGYYRIFLRNRRFHQYNRFFLLGVPVVSLLLPAMQLAVPYFLKSKTGGAPMQLLTLGRVNLEGAVTVYAKKDFWQHFAGIAAAAPAIVMAISVVLILYLCRDLFHLRKLTHTTFQRTLGRAKVHFVNERGTPFSFFWHIFWNPEMDIDGRKGQQILRHELYHVQHNHSRDVLLLEILRTLCWFNPFLHPICRETRALHEFLADEYAAAETDRLDYARLLVIGSAKTPIHLINPFFHNQIKRRIAMIINNQKTSRTLLGRFIILPLLVILFMLFSFRHLPSVAPYTKSDTLTIKDLKKLDPGTLHILTMDKANGLIRVQFKDGRTEVIPVTEELKSGYIVLGESEKNNVSNMKSIHVDNAKGLISVKVRSENWETIIAGAQKVIIEDTVEKPFTKVEFEAHYPGGIPAWIQYLTKNLKYPSEAAHDKIQGDVLVQFEVEKDGALHDITAISGPEQLKAESIRVIRESGKWIPAKQHGQVVRSYHRQPIIYKLEH